MRRFISSDGFLVCIVTILAAVLRLYALEHLPPGLYHDEAYNGLDALGVLAGQRPVFFEANNGREPLFIYLVALSVSMLGRSPLAVRLAAALLGTLSIPAAYLMTRQMLGRREALLAAVITATAFWHLNLSRVGFRAVSLPLLSALCVWMFGRGLRSRRWLDFGLAGLFLGLGLYSYLPARFAPLPFLILIPYWLWRRQPVPWKELIAFPVVAFVVACPLLRYAADHVDTFLARSAQVSIFNPAINKGDLIGTLLRHTTRALGMFNLRGDFIPRHNLPLRPVFDPIMGLAFLSGLILSMRRARERQEYALLLIHFAVMLMPTALAEDAPHFLRAVGVLPIAFVFSAVGLTAVWNALRERASLQAASTLLILLLTLSSYSTIRDYFQVHVRSEAVYYNFETGAAELASDINRFIGTGWTEQSGWAVGRQQPFARRAVYLAPRLYRDWASLRFLVPVTGNLVLLREDTAPSEAADEVQIIVWPYGEHSQHLRLLPRERLISVQQGPLERGDLETQARVLAVTYEATSLRDVSYYVGALYEHGITLVGYEIDGQGPSTRLRLIWRAGNELDADYTVFVHWIRGSQRIAQSDSYPAQGLYPTHLWRTGDTVADDHTLEAVVTPGAGDAISVGLYQLQTMERLKVLDRSGGIVADAVTLTFP
jgi:4-amino-4-deoxy-L-arabinose transferase-like glycosyltransferase